MHPGPSASGRRDPARGEGHAELPRHLEEELQEGRRGVAPGVAAPVAGLPTHEEAPSARGGLPTALEVGNRLDQGREVPRGGVVRRGGGRQGE
eukprot:15482409-Alexandrium_andersonii.AAC.1